MGAAVSIAIAGVAIVAAAVASKSPRHYEENKDEKLKKDIENARIKMNMQVLQPCHKLPRRWKVNST